MRYANGMKWVFTFATTIVGGMLWAKPAILDGSVIGYWKFDNSSNYGLDSSGYGGSSSLANATTSSGGYSGGSISLAKGNTTTFTLGSTTPACNGTTYPYYTTAARFKSGGSIVSGFSAIGVQSEIKNVLNDTSNWHFGALRYQSNKNGSTPHTGSSYNYAAILDPRYNDNLAWIKEDGSTDSNRYLEMTSSSEDFILKAPVNGVVTLGGEA